jgi:hypothetical protein
LGGTGARHTARTTTSPFAAIAGLRSAGLPARDVFKNDTYFGDFIRQLDGALAPEINGTWNELYKNGTLYLNVSEKKAVKPSSHFIKPILIEEPDF